MVATSLPFRDSLARAKKAQGDVAGAVEEYRRLVKVESGQTWMASSRTAFRPGGCAPAR
jgi:hypothetical protein